MAAEKKLSNRDETLVKILERLSDEIRTQQELLDDIANQQHDLSANLERTGLQNKSGQDVTNAAIERSRESIQQYRSDMLSLVNEQDRINLAISDLIKKQSAIAYSQENISVTLADVVKRLEAQWKDIHDANEHSVRHGEELSKDIAVLSRSTSKLHMDTEKRLSEMHLETHRKLEKNRMDIERRLLSLDKIETSLGVLLVRTEPPEKKPFFVIRAVRKLRLSVKSIWIRHKEKD